MKIIENFVRPRIQDEIESLFLDSNFPYFYNNDMPVINAVLRDGAMVDENTLSIPQFVHTFVLDSKITSVLYSHLAPIVNKLLDSLEEDCYVYRCKVNMNLIDTRFDNKYQTPHVDNGFDEQITAIYYANDSDGDTIFFDNSGKITERITPKKGKLILWKGKIFHAKCSPINSINRTVINFNLLPHQK